MSIETSAPLIEQIPDKGARLKMILELIKDAGPVGTASEAHMLISQSFETIEKSFGDELSPSEQMLVIDFEHMDSINYNASKIYYEIYNRHILLIGENGAIEIRLIDKNFPVTDKLLQKQPLFPKENMKKAFQKEGLNGNNIWGELIA